MSLNFGRSILSIPGPSVIPDRVLNAMHRPSPNIYEGELIDITETILTDLKKVARTKHNAAIYIGNGHAAWEGALASSLSTGDHILVLCTGAFGRGWGELAQNMGLVAEFLDFGLADDANQTAVEDYLRKDRGHKIKAVLTVQTDTASSVRNDIVSIRAAIDNANHPAMFMVDCIASLGCEPHEMDDWGVDVMISACQKGLMTPAGISFVFFNDKAQKARQTANLVTRYWDWQTRTKPDVFYQHFCGTAPTHHLFGIREALNILVHEEGIENAWSRHHTLAKAVWAAIEAWGKTGEIRANIAEFSKRSHAVTTVHFPTGKASELRHWCEHQAGVTLGIGLGLAPPDTPEWHSILRIGHMGHLNAHMILGTLGAMDAGMKALNITHGTGALEAASSVISSHAR